MRISFFNGGHSHSSRSLPSITTPIKFSEPIGGRHSPVRDAAVEFSITPLSHPVICKGKW
jgi:hypothetical protein